MCLLVSQTHASVSTGSAPLLSSSYQPSEVVLAGASPVGSSTGRVLSCSNAEAVHYLSLLLLSHAPAVSPDEGQVVLGGGGGVSGCSLSQLATSEEPSKKQPLAAPTLFRQNSFLATQRTSSLRLSHMLSHVSPPLSGGRLAGFVRYQHDGPAELMEHENIIDLTQNLRLTTWRQSQRVNLMRLLTNEALTTADSPYP